MLIDSCLAVILRFRARSGLVVDTPVLTTAPVHRDDPALRHLSPYESYAGLSTTRVCSVMGTKCVWKDLLVRWSHSIRDAFASTTSMLVSLRLRWDARVATAYL
jgi:hypothetical protein